MMKKHLRILAFCVYVVVLSLVGGEVIIRLFYSRFTNYNMEMWRYASEMKQPLRNGVVPFHHYPDKRGSYYGVEIKTNSFGFRDGEYSVEKPQGKYRIIMLGDSHTFGWGVPFDRIVAKVLERNLNEDDNIYEVINMGIGNYNTTMELELLKWKGLKLDPDMVILMFFLNDTEAIPPQKPGPVYALMRHSYFYSFLFGRLVRLRSRFLNTFEWSAYYHSLYSAENEENLTANRESVRDLIRLCRENDISLLIASIPELHSFRHYRFSCATEHIRTLAEEGDVPFLDLLPAFSTYKPESLWVSLEDPHANAMAHSVMATEIYEMIMKEGLLQSRGEARSPDTGDLLCPAGVSASACTSVANAIGSRRGSVVY